MGPSLFCGKCQVTKPVHDIASEWMYLLVFILDCFSFPVNYKLGQRFQRREEEEIWIEEHEHAANLASKHEYSRCHYAITPVQRKICFYSSLMRINCCRISYIPHPIQSCEPQSNLNYAPGGL